MTAHTELELAQRYAALTLNSAEIEAFEDHLVGCAECQAEVTLAVGMRQIAREPAPPAIPRRWIIAGSALLAAAAIAGFAVLGALGRDVEALGKVANPPSYIGVSVRAAPARGDSLFASAMDAYNARRYADAARGLEAAVSAGVDSIPTQFFLASAQLMSGKNRDAVTQYGHVIAAGPQAAPYLSEAHLFRARALLRLGRADEALADLQAVSEGDAEVYAIAKSLADSVHRVIRR
jgi:TolA-binding protein